MGIFRHKPDQKLAPGVKRSDKRRVMTKHGLYIWLQNRLCLSETEMHIGKFSYFRCEETIQECKKLMEQNKIKIESFSYEENKFAA
ncbi:MAG: zinc-finger-containing protein [Blautia faecis]